MLVLNVLARVLKLEKKMECKEAHARYKCVRLGKKKRGLVGCAWSSMDFDAKSLKELNWLVLAKTCRSS